MQTARHLFLDLEDTVAEPVFEGWHVALINIERVRFAIEAFKPDQLHLFSFAVYDKQDLNRFDTWLRPRLESALGMTFSSVPTVFGDIRDRCSAENRLARSEVSFSDMSDFWGKQGSFRLYAKNRFSTPLPGVSTEVMLIDDAVVTETFTFPKQRLQGHVINVNDL